MTARLTKRPLYGRLHQQSSGYTHGVSNVNAGGGKRIFGNNNNIAPLRGADDDYTPRPFCSASSSSSSSSSDVMMGSDMELVAKKVLENPKRAKWPACEDHRHCCLLSVHRICSSTTRWCLKFKAKKLIL
jgi:hypothetical protein